MGTKISYFYNLDESFELTQLYRQNVSFKNNNPTVSSNLEPNKASRKSAYTNKVPIPLHSLDLIAYQMRKC